MSSPVKVLAAIFCVLLISCGSEDTPAPEVSPQVTAATPQSAGAGGESENAGPELGSFGIDLSHQDPDIRPGDCLLYTSPSPRDKRQTRMPSSA